jgi:hypothetical protein
VAAHEGWHQFVARNFKTRPPPFLEEGLACMFENIEWEQRLPRWDVSVNHMQLAHLRAALRDGSLLPLSRLCAMHAGQVVATSRSQIQAFYAQSWAFARFLLATRDSRRDALRRMLLNLAGGQWESQAGRGAILDPAGAIRLLEHYLGEDISKIDGEYRRYVIRICSALPDETGS